MSNSLVSIIVPVYNTEKYLRKCLDSIIYQTYINFEAIIVNDGSPDESEKIIDEYTQKDKRFIKLNKVNGGLSSARNFGIEASSGDYIVFIDSDDWIGSNYLFKFISLIENADIVIGGYTLEDSVINRTLKIYQPKTDELEFDKSNVYQHILLEHVGPKLKNESNKKIQITLMPVWKNMYRLSLIKNNNIRFLSEREIMLEDYYFNLLAYSCAKKVVISESVEYHHLIVDGSLSRKIRPTMFNMMKKLYKQTENYINNNDFHSPSILLERLSRFELKSSIDTLYNASLGDYKQFIDIYHELLTIIRGNAELKNYRKLDIPFFYKYFINRVLKDNPQKLYSSFKMARKLNFWYRYYRAVFRHT